MSEEVKGVFVRLPLGEEQVESVLNSYTGDKESTNICMQKTILDLGTPVTGGDIPVATHLVGARWERIPLVRQSDAQAHIAALEAEVVRLREALESLENANNNLCFMRSNDTYQSMMRDGCGDLLAKLDDARRSAREALKGGAA